MWRGGAVISSEGFYGGRDLGHGTKTRICIIELAAKNFGGLAMICTKAKLWMLLGILLSSQLLGGCQTIATSNIASATNAEGVPYALPKILLEGKLIRNANGVAVVIGSPIYVADGNHSYTLAYTPSSTAEDILKIKVDNATMLLKSVNAEADDKSGEILANFAKAALVGLRGGESSGLGGEQILYSAVFDPQVLESVTSFEKGLNQALSNFLIVSTNEECDAAVRQAQATKLPEDRKKRAAKLLELSDDAKRKTAACQTAGFKLPELQIVIEDYMPFGGSSGSSAVDCSIGFCVRGLSPAIIKVSIKDKGLVASQVFNMPNGSKPIAYRLGRAGFTKATYTATLRNGIIESTENTKGSELLAISKLPLDVVKGALTAVSEIVQLRVNVQNNEKALQDAIKAKIEAQQAAKKTAEDAKAPKTAAEASLQNGEIIRAVLPGLGENSLFAITIEQASKLPAANAEKPIEKPKTGSKPATAADTKQPESELDGPVQPGSDGGV